MRKSLLGLALVALLAVATPARAQDCEHSRDLDLSHGVDGATLVRIIAEAGDLVVEGGAGSEITVTGRACASSAGRLDDMSLEIDRSGDRLVIETRMPDGWNWIGNSYAYMDLEIRVPGDLDLDIEDGSGNVTLRDLGGDVRLEDGSGNVTAVDLRGDFDLDDGSGNIDVSGVAGEVRVVDGSGNIDIRDAGSVLIDDDGSGNITVADVDGDVTVGDDGSGNITVEDIGGDLVVHDDGSGSIRYDRIAGMVDIPDDKR